MDTPKHQVSWLESFLPDIWAYFAWYLPGEQLGRLMMTGATLLRQRLKSPRVVRSIKLGRDFILFKSFPTFLNDFPSLEELYIHSAGRKWSEKLALRIDFIPSGVKRLELTGDWARAFDNLFVGENGAPLRLNEYLPHLEVLKFGYRTLFNKDDWMLHAPQSLTHLKSPSWCSTILPPSLIHLELRTTPELASLPLASILPPRLETFIVDDLMQDPDFIVRNLPRSTRKLSLKSSYYSDAIEHLPESLTWLKVQESKAMTLKLSDLPSILPSTLTELHLEPAVPCSAWHLFPPQLITLSLGVAEFESTIASTIVDHLGVARDTRSIPFDYLPTSITSLELKLNLSSRHHIFCVPPPALPSDRQYFPPQITRLSMKPVQLALQTVKLLPSTLTFLEIKNLCERVSEHLPKNLKSLRSRDAWMTPKIVEFLPKSLTSLDLDLTLIYEGVDCDSGIRVNVNDISEHLRHEECISPTFDWKDLPRLPSTLTYLQIGVSSKLGDNFLRHQQLPNLLTLKMGNAQAIVDFPLLAPNLTHLDLRSSGKINGSIFPSLPRSLTYLNLMCAQSIIDSDIQHLPRTLKYANFQRAKHLTDNCIPDLPPQLEWLDIRCSMVTTASLSRLPFYLQYCETMPEKMWKDDRRASGEGKLLRYMSRRKLSWEKI